MNDPATICPKCNGPLTELQGGLRHCAGCGFEGEAPPAAKPRAFGSSKTAFWILLVAPAALALGSFLVGYASPQSGVVVGFAGLVSGAIAAIYCGCWLGVRFGRTDGARVAITLVLIPAIAAVNFFIVCAGCARTLQF